jgi:hypothetical protein
MNVCVNWRSPVHNGGLRALVLVVRARFARRRRSHKATFRKIGDAIGSADGVVFTSLKL